MTASAPIHRSEDFDVADQASHDPKPSYWLRGLASANRAGRLRCLSVAVRHFVSPRSIA